ncbi:UNVERIFIED_CONTAM: hypothetical protein K2H54_037672 [Gekko kuhli]
MLSISSFSSHPERARVSLSNTAAPNGRGSILKPPSSLLSRASDSTEKTTAKRGKKATLESFLRRSERQGRRAGVHTHRPRVPTASSQQLIEWLSLSVAHRGGGRNNRRDLCVCVCTRERREKGGEGEEAL